MRGWLLMAVLMAVLVWPLGRIAACSTADNAVTARILDEQVRTADVIVHAQVPATATADVVADATIAVWAYYKGNGPADLVIGGVGPTEQCGQPLTAGSEVLLFLTRAADGRLTLLPQIAVEDVSPAVLQQVEALTGQAPWLPNPPSAALRDTAGWPGPLTYLGAVMLLIAGVMLVRARRRAGQEA